MDGFEGKTPRARYDYPFAEPPAPGAAIEVAPDAGWPPTTDRGLIEPIASQIPADAAGGFPIVGLYLEPEAAQLDEDPKRRSIDGLKNEFDPVFMTHRGR